MNRFYALTLCLLGCLTACTQQRVITIVHTNDTHSQIDPLNQKGSLIGGVEERATLLDLMRHTDKDLIYLDAGDMVQGQPYFNLWKGELEVLCMNQQQLVASTFGNHEFDNGLESLLEMLKTARYKLVNCNYHCENTILKDYVVPHLIIERQGVRIGITGVTCNPNQLIFNSHWQGIEYEPASPAVNREARLLREEGCDLVLVLSHEGYNGESDSIMDRMIAAQSHDIDMIIGGHTHTNLEQGVVVPNADGKPVMITQTGGKSNDMGVARIYCTTSWGKCTIDSIVCSKIHHDQYVNTPEYQAVWDTIGMRRLVAPFRDQLTQSMGVVIGHTDIDLLKGDNTSTLSQYTAQAYLQIGKTLTGLDIDASIMNLGGLRNEIPAGDITVGHIYQVFPFDNTIAVARMQGRYIKKMFAERKMLRMPAMAGLEMTDKGLRINGKAIDPDHVYNICTIDYLIEGNDGFTDFARADSVIDTGVFIRDAMINYHRVSRIASEPPSRIAYR